MQLPQNLFIWRYYVILLPELQRFREKLKKKKKDREIGY